MSDERIYVGAALLVAAIISIALFVSVYIPSNVNGEQVFVRTSVVTSVQTAYLSTVVTSTQTETALSTEYVTTTMVEPLPATIQVSGQAQTSGVGTTPSGISFTAQSGSVSQSQVVSGGPYNVTLANNEIYQITIQYSATPSGGECFVGVLVLATTSPTMSATFSC